MQYLFFSKINNITSKSKKKLEEQYLQIKIAIKKSKRYLPSRMRKSNNNIAIMIVERAITIERAIKKSKIYLPSRMKKSNNNIAIMIVE